MYLVCDEHRTAEHGLEYEKLTEGYRNTTDSPLNSGGKRIGEVET